MTVSMERGVPSTEAELMCPDRYSCAVVAPDSNVSKFLGNNAEIAIIGLCDVFMMYSSKGL